MQRVTDVPTAPAAGEQHDLTVGTPLRLGWEQTRMAAGDAVQLELSIGQFTCTFVNGEYWPAGTYQLYTSIAVSEPAPGMTGVLHAPMVEFTLP